MWDDECVKSGISLRGGDVGALICRYLPQPSRNLQKENPGLADGLTNLSFGRSLAFKLHIKPIRALSPHFFFGGHEVGV